MAAVPENYGSKYYRELLSSQGKAFYDKIFAQISKGDYSGETSLVIQSDSSAASDCFEAYKALRDDHPEFFFLGFQSEFISRGNIGIFKYTILYSLDTIQRIKLQMRKSIYRMVRGTASLSLMNREKIVYERIAKQINYSDHGDVRDHNVVGPILTSSGVCEGYNSLLMLCYRRIGIPCIKAYGKTKTGSWHCWTIAWIGNDPVHCDVTWDGADSGFVSFDYFNLSDSQISADHFEFKSSRIPICKEETLNYYQINNLVVNSYVELRKIIRTDSQYSTYPILIHFNYIPAHEDYMNEVQRALNDECLYGKHGIFCHSGLRNIAIKKI